MNDLDSLPLTKLHLMVLLVCCVGFSFDLAEIAFGNILSAVFSAPPHSVSSATLSWLLGAVYIGAAVGAPLLGTFADRYGRRTVLLSAMLILAVVSVLAGAASDIGALIVWRIFAGISLGAYPPLMFAYLTDILPPSRRGPLIVTATAVSYIGPPAFIFLVRALTPISPLGLEAWRWGFFAAAAGAAICAVGFWRLPESPRWLISKGRVNEAEILIERLKTSQLVLPEKAAAYSGGSADAVKPSSKPASFAREAIFLAALYFLTPWATVGFTVLSGAVLVQKGINLQDSLLFVGISTFGPIVGTLCGGFLVDRAERKPFLIANAIGMGLVGLAFGASELPLSLIATALMFNVILSLFMPVLVLYAAETTSTQKRGKLTSWAWTANRVGSAVVPIALLPILHQYGAFAMFVVIAGTLVAFISLLAIYGPKGEAGRIVR
jgi:putative MFS transporter